MEKNKKSKILMILKIVLIFSIVIFILSVVAIQKNLENIRNKNCCSGYYEEKFGYKGKKKIQLYREKDGKSWYPTEYRYDSNGNIIYRYDSDGNIIGVEKEEYKWEEMGIMRWIFLSKYEEYLEEYNKFFKGTKSEEEFYTKEFFEKNSLLILIDWNDEYKIHDIQEKGTVLNIDEWHLEHKEPFCKYKHVQAIEGYSVEIPVSKNIESFRFINSIQDEFDRFKEKNVKKYTSIEKTFCIIQAISFIIFSGISIYLLIYYKKYKTLALVISILGFLLYIGILIATPSNIVLH